VTNDNFGGYVGDVERAIRVGEPVVVDSRSPRLTDKIAVFEDDGDTGYLYAAEDGSDDTEVLDALHLYDAAGVRDADRDHTLQLVWDRAGVAVALVLNGWAHAMIDFERPLAMCIDDFPPPTGFVASHTWDEAAFKASFPSLRSEWEWRSTDQTGRK
jgi:hypothetical protein